jgi:hypothetical protein
MPRTRFALSPVTIMLSRVFLLALFLSVAVVFSVAAPELNAPKESAWAISSWVLPSWSFPSVSDIMGLRRLIPNTLPSLPKPFDSSTWARGAGEVSPATKTTKVSSSPFEYPLSDIIDFIRGAVEDGKVKAEEERRKVDELESQVQRGEKVKVMRHWSDRGRVRDAGKFL